MCLPIIYQFFKYLLASELERTQTVKFVWSFGIICLGLSLSSLSVYAGNTYTGCHAKSSFVSNRMVQGLPPTVSSVSDMNLTREEDGFARNQTWSSLKKYFSTDRFLRYTLSRSLRKNADLWRQGILCQCFHTLEQPTTPHLLCPIPTHV